MLHEIIMSGFGGQGLMSMGQLLAYAGMEEGKNVSWMPSYGPEMRGGTAYCNVIVSDAEIASPLVTEASCVIVMNRPSLDRFENAVKPGGILLMNSSLINRQPTRTDIRVYEIPADDLAMEIGSTKVANMIMLGAFLALTNAVSVDTVLEYVKKKLPERFLEMNKKALAKGAELVTGAVTK